MKRMMTIRLRSKDSQAKDAAFRVSGFTRGDARQIIEATAGMGIQVGPWLGFAIKVIKHMTQHHMLQHVCMITGVIDMLITQHVTPSWIFMLAG